VAGFLRNVAKKVSVLRKKRRTVQRKKTPMTIRQIVGGYYHQRSLLYNKIGRADGHKSFDNIGNPIYVRGLHSAEVGPQKFQTPTPPQARGGNPVGLFL